MNTINSPLDWHRAHQAYATLALETMEAIEGKELSEDNRLSMAQTLWVLCVEDLQAVSLLMERRWLASARSLARPQFESLCRGGWLVRCASNDEAESIAGYGRPFPLLRPVLRALEAAPQPFEILGGRIPLQSLADRLLDSMHDFTHRGTRAIALRLVANGAGEDHIDETEAAVFQLTALLGCAAAAALLESCGDGPAALQAIKRLNRTVPAWGGLCQP